MSVLNTVTTFNAWFSVSEAYKRRTGATGQAMVISSVTGDGSAGSSQAQISLGSQVFSQHLVRIVSVQVTTTNGAGQGVVLQCSVTPRGRGASIVYALAGSEFTPPSSGISIHSTLKRDMAGIEGLLLDTNALDLISETGNVNGAVHSLRVILDFIPLES